jgi:hypothetical protein
MAEQKMLEFFRQKNSKTGPGDIDWQAKRDTWIKAVEDLYRTITDQYLAGPKAEGIVTFLFSEKPIVEEFIGTYKVREMVVQVGNEKVLFSPKGVNIVGAAGRIDIVGDRGQVTVVRQPGDRWGVVESRTPTLRVVPLNEETLLAALKRVMRP